MPESTAPVRFGEFLFDPVSGELSRGDETVRLAPQIAAVLRLLVSRAGEVIGRTEFHEALWPNTTVEFDQGLNFCIRQLRVALSDDADRPRYIETLPRRGYRFIAPMSFGQPPVATETPAAIDVPIPVDAPIPRPRRTFAIAGLAAAVGVVGVAVLAMTGLPWARSDARRAVVGKPEVLAVLRFDLLPPDSSLAGIQASLVEQLVASLTRDGPGDISVMGPSFTSRFPGMQTFPDTIRSALGATYMLSGALRRTGAGRVTRVFAQFIRLADRKHVMATVQFDSTGGSSSMRLTAIADSIARGVRGVIARSRR